MALPIRLVVGPDNLMDIPLEAQSLDISVDRNASAFPTPNNIVGRVAIDTNIPTIGIEIGGIFQDDDAFTSETGATKSKVSGGDIQFNFASAMPTSNIVNFESWYRETHLQQTTFVDYMTVNFKSNFGIGGSPGSIDIYDLPNEVDSGNGYDAVTRVDLVEGRLQSANQALSAVNHPSSGTYSAGSTSVVVDSSANFRVKDRIHLANGTFVGVVTAISSNTLSFHGGTEVALADNTDLHSFSTTVYTAAGQVVGSVVDIVLGTNPKRIKEITLDGFSQPVYKYVDYYMVLDGRQPPIENNIDNKSIFLYPNHWRIDTVTKRYSSNGAPARSEPIAVELAFSSDMAHQDYQNQTFGGTQVVGAYPSIVQKGRHYPQTNDSGDRTNGSGNDIRVKIPIGGISTHAVNGNPASTLALIVKKALELTDDAMEIGYIDSGTGETIPDAFSVITSGPMLRVKQKVQPINRNLMSVLEPCFQFDASQQITLDSAVFTHGTLFQSNATASIEFFTDVYETYSVSTTSKSAGDKVQDLIGIVSNAKKNRDLIRGIQIPYDSLIQSDAVTPTARNFFLTFGQQDNDAKGSSGNTLSASHTMIPGLLPGDLGGDPLPDRGSGLLDNIAEFGDAVMALAGFVGNFIGDTFVTLLSDPHGNDGGIRIIPEKLHVRYDAGNNYYAFNLRLLASDFVIGV